MIACPENTYCRGSITVQFVSSFTSLDSAASLHTNSNKSSCSVKSNPVNQETSCTNSDTSPSLDSATSVHTKNNIISLLVKSSLIKLQTRCTVILPICCLFILTIGRLQRTTGSTSGRRQQKWTGRRVAQFRETDRKWSSWSEAERSRLEEGGHPDRVCSISYSRWLILIRLTLPYSVDLFWTRWLALV